MSVQTATSEKRQMIALFSSERLACTLETVIFSSLLILMVLVAIPYGTVEPWWNSAFECCVFVLSALSVLHYFLTGSPRIGPLSVILPLLALALFSFFQSLAMFKATEELASPVWRAISADPYETRRFFFRVLALILTGTMLLRFTSNRRRLYALIHVVVAVALMSAVFGIVRQTMQHGSGFILPYLNEPGSYAQFINKNHFAYLMEMAVGLLAGLILGGAVVWNRIPFYLTAAVVMWAALILSNSRGGLLAMGVEFVVLILLLASTHSDLGKTRKGPAPWVVKVARSYTVRAILIFCLLLALIVSISWVGGEPLVSQLERAPGDFIKEGSEQLRNTSRRDIWLASWRLFEAHPIIGSGFGGYWVAVTKHHNASGDYTPQQAHNDYLEILAGGGLLGAFLIALTIFAFVRVARSQLNASDRFRRAACYGALVGLAGIAVHSLVDFGLHVTINALVFVALAVIATVEIPASHNSSESSGG